MAEPGHDPSREQERERRSGEADRTGDPSVLIEYLKSLGQLWIADYI